MATRLTRDDVAECLDPGFLTICHHTKVALSDGWGRTRVRLRSFRYAAAGRLARARYSSPLVSIAQMMRAVLLASATMTTL
jgi:hypothetical protein